jgi:hypothetical protein
MIFRWLSSSENNFIQRPFTRLKGLSKSLCSPVPSTYVMRAKSSPFSSASVIHLEQSIRDSTIIRSTAEIGGHLHTVFALLLQRIIKIFYLIVAVKSFF